MATTRTGPKPTETHDHVLTVACPFGFTLQFDGAEGWICVPAGHGRAMGFGSTPTEAIADAAHALRIQGDTRC